MAKDKYVLQYDNMTHSLHRTYSGAFLAGKEKQKIDYKVRGAAKYFAIRYQDDLLFEGEAFSKGMYDGSEKD